MAETLRAWGPWKGRGKPAAVDPLQATSLSPKQAYGQDVGFLDVSQP